MEEAPPIKDTSESQKLEQDEWVDDLQNIIWHPCHPSHLWQDPESILRTFLEQFFLFW